MREARERASGSTNLLHKHLIADERLIAGPLAASQGLLDNNATLLYVDAARQQATLNQPASRELARKVAEEGITLLTNKEKRLPLMGLGSAPLKTIAVLGPNADNPHSTLGVSRAFYLVHGPFWLRFTYATPILITKLRLETPGQLYGAEPGSPGTVTVLQASHIAPLN